MSSSFFSIRCAGSRTVLGHCSRLFIAFLFALSSIALGGCVIVPYTPKAETSKTSFEVQPEEPVYLTIGPRTVLDEVEEAVRNHAPSLRFVDRLQFRDAAFPEGGWKLSELLSRENGCSGAFAAADYLVVLGRPRYDSANKKGDVVFYLGFFGASKADQFGAWSALVIDLAQCRPLTLVTTRTKGKQLGAAAFYGLFISPRIEKSILIGLSRGIADVLEQAGSHQKWRVALLAAETESASKFLAPIPNP